MEKESEYTCLVNYIRGFGLKVSQWAIIVSQTKTEEVRHLPRRA